MALVDGRGRKTNSMR